MRGVRVAVGGELHDAGSVCRENVKPEKGLLPPG